MVDTNGTDRPAEEPRWLRKGWFLRAAFDDAYNDPDTRQDRYDEALALLADDGNELDQMTATEGWNAPQREEFGDADREHFREHWLSGDWFGVDGDVTEYLRRAFTEAIGHAKERNVGLEAIWITTGEAGRLDIGYVDNPNSVLIVIKTPTMPPRLVMAKRVLRPGEDWREIRQIPHAPIA
jgi:hypothetical protein